MVWENALNDIQSSVDEKGCFHWTQSWTKFVEKYRLNSKGKAPIYLSIDFWNNQRLELKQRNLYVIRLGQGSFGIFNQKVYPKPYLELNTNNTDRISFEIPSNYSAMKEAFRVVDNNLHAAEDTLLELCRFYGVFRKMLGILGESDYQVGPRGFFTSKFDLFFKRNGEFTKFTYDGQVELDYSVWTENRVLVFEAKSNNNNGGLDIGWHKLAFPSQRFNDSRMARLKINPVYFLRRKDKSSNLIFIYLFPEISFKEEGVVLNDEVCWKPLKVWSLDLDSLRE